MNSRYKLIFVIVLMLVVTSCASGGGSKSSWDLQGESKPKNIDNICSIFSEKEHWINSAKESHEEWGIPIELMMAIIRYESSFRSTARPLDKDGKPVSSAYGYAQAIDGTWDLYKKDNNVPRARRTDFADAIDFVGWYSSKAISKGQDISPFDVNALYVFYHDGWNALPEDGSREIKQQVLQVAGKVYQRTLIYHRQLRECPRLANSLYEGGVATWSSDKAGRKRNGSSTKKPKWF